jgi:flavorubredoxin
MIMPWGKHKDKDIEDIPSYYLQWLAENCDNERIAVAADEEWDFRERTNSHIFEELKNY